MKAELVPENGDPPIPITRDITVIGRREFCDVQVNDGSLSKRHAVVVKTDGLLVIRDLGTTNGTKVKGQRVRWAALLPDDRVSLGAYKVRVYLGPDDVPGPSESAKAGGARRPSAVPAPKSAKTNGKPAAPIPVAIPVGNEDDLEILEDGSDDDSGWRKLMEGRKGHEEEDVIIELD